MPLLRAAAAIPSVTMPSAAREPPAGPGLAAQETLAVPTHVLPLQVPVAVASIFVVKTPLSAVTHCCTLLALTYAPLQKMAPVSWHCVVQSLASCCLHVAKLLSWHCSWHVAFACPVQDPVQSALHFVVQSAVVETVVHCVEQWSLQHSLQEASQSLVNPEDDVLVEHDELQSPLHRELQSVWQSTVVLDAHFVEQSDSHDDVQLASAVAVH